MKNANKKIYTVKRPSHPASAHTKAKRFFKRKSRKIVRVYLKRLLKKEMNDSY